MLKRLWMLLPIILLCLVVNTLLADLKKAA